MKKFTQEEFDSLPVNKYQIKSCPSGDYTEIKSFGDYCTFGEGSIFGDYCTFGECNFSGYCTFGIGCNFSSQCYFGINCTFNKQCNFGAGCSFGAGCKFIQCSFGTKCSFGERCNFGKHCRCEFGEFQHMLSAGGFSAGGETIYFFLLCDESICVRHGSFSGTLEEWERFVNDTYNNDNTAKAYLALVPAIQLQFNALTAQ